MTEQKAPVPTQITLHKKSKTLELEYATGERFVLPSRYLRMFSPSADARGKEIPTIDTEHVNILAIEPVGQYAIKLIFSDGHRTGLYSWDTLYELSVNWLKTL